MLKILFVSNKSNQDRKIDHLLTEVGYDIIRVYDEEKAFFITEEFMPDIALINSDNPKIDTAALCKKLKLRGQNNDIQIILLVPKENGIDDLLAWADGYITKPFSESIIIATINAHRRIKKLLDILYNNNKDLAKSLYQLNVLYNTSSQLAGTLDKTKLISIMNEGLEKSLNFSLCTILALDDEIKLLINSEKPISKRLELALKIRTFLAYKDMFEGDKLPHNISINDIRIENIVRNEDDNVLDLEVFNYRKQFLAIKTTDKFFGTVEILRERDFTTEDKTYFQTVVKQVSLPLESAILYEELQNTNEKLAKLEQLKSEFISIVSHELRTPLTAIKNSLDIILTRKAGDLTDIQANFLEMSKRNVDRLGKIINDLLDLSKIEAGKMEFKFEKTSIKGTMEFVRSTFENVATSKSVDLILETEENLPDVYVDVSKLEQILTNLVSNALKYTQQGYVKISTNLIDAENLDKGKIKRNFVPRGKHIKVTVKDSGIGIKQEDLEKVFDKFQQIESSLSRDVGGTGLGLPIAKELIEAHRGFIWAESIKGDGTEFSFILPVINKRNIILCELEKYMQYASHNDKPLTIINLRETGLGKSIIEEIMSKLDEFNLNSDEYLIYEDEKSADDSSIKILCIDKKRMDAEKVLATLKDKLAIKKDLWDKKRLFAGIGAFPADAKDSEGLLGQSQKSLKCIYDPRQ